MENLLNEIFEMRMNTALESKLLESDACMVSTKNVHNAKSKLLEMGLNKKQKEALDDVTEAMSEYTSIYGNAAYEQGFSDSLLLMKACNKIVSDEAFNILKIK